MPELPEVETVANGVNERVRGDWIESVWLGDKPEPLKSPAELIAAGLTGSRIDWVHRVGKTIVFDLSKPDSSGTRLPADPSTVSSVSGSRTTVPATSQFLVHLGMTGRLLVCQAEVAVPPHTHWIGRLRSGRELRFVDARRFGRLSVLALDPSMPMTTAGAAPETFQGTGLEPLEITAKDFLLLFKGRKTPIKSALLNQKLLHGVGNIYADEALFRAGVRPRRQAARLTRAELARLHGALQAVLRQAIELGGSSVSDYVDADGVRGFFQLEHRVYQRTGQPCAVCSSAIQRVVIAGRSSHFCPRCQR